MKKTRLKSLVIERVTFWGVFSPFIPSFVFFLALKKVYVPLKKYLGLHSPLWHAPYLHDSFLVTTLCMPDAVVVSTTCHSLIYILSWFFSFLPDIPFIWNRLSPLVCTMNSLPKILIKHALLQESVSVTTLSVGDCCQCCLMLCLFQYLLWWSCFNVSSVVSPLNRC